MQAHTYLIQWISQVCYIHFVRKIAYRQQTGLILPHDWNLNTEAEYLCFEWSWPLALLVWCRVKALNVQPCLTEHDIKSEVKPLFWIHIFEFWNSILTHFWNLKPKPIFSRHISIHFHSTLSNALWFDQKILSFLYFLYHSMKLHLG